MIAPPHYKCEVMTLDKHKGFSKLEEALSIIEKVIKEKKGTFKVLNRPQIIGHKDDKDIEDIMQKIQDDKDDDASDNEEDNEEGIDIDLGEEGDGDEEEKKEEKKEGKKSKKKADSDEDDSA